MAERHDAVSVIVTKRDGGRLSDSMVDWVVDITTPAGDIVHSAVDNTLITLGTVSVIIEITS